MIDCKWPIAEPKMWENHPTAKSGDLTLLKTGGRHRLHPTPEKQVLNRIQLLDLEDEEHQDHFFIAGERAELGKFLNEGNRVRQELSFSIGRE